MTKLTCVCKREDHEPQCKILKERLLSKFPPDSAHKIRSLFSFIDFLDYLELEEVIYRVNTRMAEVMEKQKLDKGSYPMV